MKQKSKLRSGIGSLNHLLMTNTFFHTGSVSPRICEFSRQLFQVCGKLKHPRRVSSKFSLQVISLFSPFRGIPFQISSPTIYVITKNLEFRKLVGSALLSNTFCTIAHEKYFIIFQSSGIYQQRNKLKSSFNHFCFGFKNLMIFTALLKEKFC